jgi:hypothetical protein
MAHSVPKRPLMMRKTVKTVEGCKNEDLLVSCIANWRIYDSDERYAELRTRFGLKRLSLALPYLEMRRPVKFSFVHELALSPVCIFQS